MLKFMEENFTKLNSKMNHIEKRIKSASKNLNKVRKIKTNQQMSEAFNAKQKLKSNFVLDDTLPEDQFEENSRPIYSPNIVNFNSQKQGIGIDTTMQPRINATLRYDPIENECDFKPPINVDRNELDTSLEAIWKSALEDLNNNKINRSFKNVLNLSILN